MPLPSPALSSNYLSFELTKVLVADDVIDDPLDLAGSPLEGQELTYCGCRLLDLLPALLEGVALLNLLLGWVL